MTGKNWVIVVTLTLLSMSAFTIVVVTLTSGTSGLLPRLARFVFTAALCYYLYQGRNWIRWLTVILLGLGVAIAASNGLALLESAPLAGVITLGLGIVYACCVAILVIPATVREHFAQ